MGFAGNGDINGRLDKGSEIKANKREKEQDGNRTEEHRQGKVKMNGNRIRADVMMKDRLGQKENKLGPAPDAF